MKLLVILLIFIVKIGFSQECPVENHDEVSKKTKFSLLKKIEFRSDTLFVRYDGVYMGAAMFLDTIYSYSFIRFYKNGTFVNSARYKCYPSSEQRQNPTVNQNGVFISNNGNLIMEQYGHYLGYFYEFGLIDQSRVMINGYSTKLYSKKHTKYISPIICYFVKDSSY